MSKEISASKSIDNRGLARRCLAALALMFFTLTWACGCKSVEGIETPITQVSPSPSVIVPTRTSSPSPTSTQLTFTATASHPQPYCDSQVGDWVENQNTVTCYSYWGPDVREAISLDMHSRINAAYLDLETGNTSENTADIYYLLSCGSSACGPIWYGMEGVIIEGFGDFIINTPSVLPKFEDCAEIIIGETYTRSYPLDISYGYYSCIQTGEGRIGWIRYDTDFRSAYNPYTRSAQITYWLWDRTISDYINPPLTPYTPAPYPTSTPVIATVTPTGQAYCDSENGNWLEKEHKVSCFSFWGPDVQEAYKFNLFTKYNAVYLDLETGSTSENTADIYYQIICDILGCYPRWVGLEDVTIEHYIDVNKKDIPPYPPTLEQCNETMLHNEYKASSYPQLLEIYGHFSCIRTRERRVGWIRYDRDFNSTHAQGRSQITYWLWNFVISNKD